MLFPTKLSGVTLVELAVVLLVAAILASIAAPSFMALINSTRLNSITSELVSSLYQARSEAIKRNSRVLICTRNLAGTNCDATSNWQSG